MNLVMALDCAVEPLAFKAFFPAHVTDTATPDPEVAGLPEELALPEAGALPEVIAPLEVIAPEVIAPAPEVIAPEVIAPLEAAPGALGVLVAAAALEALLGVLVELLLLPHAASNATHTVMTPAAMLVLFRLTWFSSEEIRDRPAVAGGSRDIDERLTPPGRAFAALGSV